MTTRPGYTQETRDRAVRMVADQAHTHPTEWAAIRSISSKIGCSAETLRLWVRRAEIDAGTRHRHHQRGRCAHQGAATRGRRVTSRS